LPGDVGSGTREAIVKYLQAPGAKARPMFIHAAGKPGLGYRNAIIVFSNRLPLPKVERPMLAGASP
jgi:hypothetical protein